MNLILYGPPGVGKSTVGALAAAALGRPFVDGDAWIEARWGRPVADYFAAGEVALFRAREVEAYRHLAAQDDLVIAPGGGALLEPHTRAALEGTGTLVCLDAPPATLLARLKGGPERPLLAGNPAERLAELLRARAALYASFALRVDTEARTPAEVAAAVVERFRAAAGQVRFELAGCTAVIGRGLRAQVPAWAAEKGVAVPAVVVADTATGPLYGAALAAQLGAGLAQFEAGEAHKTLATAGRLYGECLRHGLERGGSLAAVGGGVVGDVAGFVAATYMRGVAWVNIPTTLLAMVDAGLGGKVGVDLPEGKNLVGAFHPPVVVLSDLDVLSTLPEREARCGMAEVIKSAVIGDPDLFRELAEGCVGQASAIARAAAVKVGIVNADLRERGERAVLNLGHTIGHGIEAASGYALQHGEAIAVGLVAEARLAELIGLAEAGLAETLASCLRRAGLPLRAPGLPPAEIKARMQADKKKAGGKLKFALPRRLGEVVWGVSVDEAALDAALEEATDGE